MLSRFWVVGPVIATCAIFGHLPTSFSKLLVTLFETCLGLGNVFVVGSCLESPSPAVLEGGVGEANSRHH